jgi:hypothetical protein
MFISKEEKQTFSKHFLTPANTAHRRYEALRGYFVEGLSSKKAADRFGYSPGSFRGLVHQFRLDPKRSFFATGRAAANEPGRPDIRRQKVVALRKQNLSVYDISRALARDNVKLSPVAIGQILKLEGFARLPRRRDEERPAAPRPITADVADVRQLDLGQRQFRTQFGGLFLFMSDLVGCGLDRLLKQAGFPGSEMVPPGCAMRSLLALKLYGNARHSRVMSHVLDEGLGLFAGLNLIPKRSFLTEYSCRVEPDSHAKLMSLWLDAARQQGLKHGSSFDLDFHTIPFHGEDALIGRDPEEVIFDSKLTTYANLNQLNRRGIEFITLRRRPPNLMHELALKPASAWRTIELQNIARQYRNPRIIDQRINLAGYQGLIRQIIITNLGHEEPTVLLTNQLKRSAPRLIGRYAQRMIIENTIADGIDFFHMDALSSAVAMKVNCDLQLTLMASGLYRMLGQRIGNGYERAKSRSIFDDLVHATAAVTIASKEIEVRFQKRAHNPLLLAAGFDKTNAAVPWLGNKRLRLIFG